MTVITNLRIPWITSLPQDNNFDVSRDQLVDPGNQIAVLDSSGLSASVIDWQSVAFDNVGDLNGTPIANFLTNITGEQIGDLSDVDALVSSSPQNGDILFYDGVTWNRIPRGIDGQFLKSSATTIQWGTGISQINDFSDADFRLFSDADATKEVAFDASLITSGQTRTFQLPDGDGVLARLSDIPTVSGTFADDAFAVTDNVDPTKILNFQIAGITTATTRTATWPDKDGVVAMLSDITTPGNTFNDSLFRIFGNVDNTKLIAFEADTFITTATTRTVTMIDEDLVILGRDNAQTVINKVINAPDNTLTNIGKTETIASFVHTDQINTYTPGFKQILGSDATNAGFNLAGLAGDPSVLVDGDIWHNVTSDKIFARLNGVNVDLSSVTPQDSSFVIVASDEATDLDTLNNPKTTFRMTFGYTLNTGVGLALGVRGSLTTAPTGSDVIFDIKQGGVSILSAPMHIDAGDTTSVGSATVITLNTSVLTDNAEITVEITQIGSTTAGTGLKVYFIGSS